MTKIPDDSDGEELIDLAHVGLGIYEGLEKSKKIFSDGKFLFEKKRFQSSIPLFVISIEEALKAHELSIKFRKYQGVTKKEWNKLLDHKHKLVHTKEFVISNLEQMDEKTLENVKKETNTENYDINISQMITSMKSQINIDSNLQSLREKCYYTDWDYQNSQWDNFDKIDQDKQEDLAFYVMKRAEDELTQLHFGIEFAINVLRRDGKKLVNLSYPKYDELREIKNYESSKLIHKLSRGERQKFFRGERIMEKFVSTKAFHLVHQEIPSDLLKKNLALIEKLPADKWFPHPIIRALFLALSGLREKDAEEGKYYYGMSGNADETYEGKPTMLTTAIVGWKEGKISLEKIMIITDDSIQYSFSDKIIEKILETELVIERFQGIEIPLEAVHEAFSKIGIKLRKLKEDEIEPAINHAKGMASKIEGIPKDMIPKIMNTTKDNWETTDPSIRAMIATAYLGTLDPEENTLILSSYIDPIRKFKVRDMIYYFLKKNQLIMNF